MPTDGTMQRWRRFADRVPALAFVDSCLRGVGQVIFMNNPLTGFAVLVGYFVASPSLFASAAAGAVVSTATAQLLRFDRALIRAGVYGFNGTLAGAAMAIFLVPSWKAGFIGSVIGLAIMASITMAALAALLGAVELPALTLPFNFVTIPYLWATSAVIGIERAPILEALPLAEMVEPTLRLLPEGPALPAAAAILELGLRGVGQLFLADDAISGLLILIGIVVCSRIAGIVAIVGSLVGGSVGLLLGADGFAIAHGWWGYNAYVTFVAISGVFFVLDWRSAIFGLLGAIAAAILYGGLSRLLGGWGAPALTLPFCIITLVFLLVRRSTSIFRPVPIERLSTPEAHRHLEDDRK